MRLTLGPRRATSDLPGSRWLDLAHGAGSAQVSHRVAWAVSEVPLMASIADLVICRSRTNLPAPGEQTRAPRAAGRHRRVAPAHLEPDWRRAVTGCVLVALSRPIGLAPLACLCAAAAAAVGGPAGGAAAVFVLLAAGVLAGVLRVATWRVSPELRLGLPAGLHLPRIWAAAAVLLVASTPAASSASRIWLTATGAALTTQLLLSWRRPAAPAAQREGAEGMPRSTPSNCVGNGQDGRFPAGSTYSGSAEPEDRPAVFNTWVQEEAVTSFGSVVADPDRTCAALRAAAARYGAVLVPVSDLDPIDVVASVLACDMYFRTAPAGSTLSTFAMTAGCAGSLPLAAALGRSAGTPSRPPGQDLQWYPDERSDVVLDGLTLAQISRRSLGRVCAAMGDWAVEHLGEEGAAQAFRRAASDLSWDCSRTESRAAVAVLLEAAGRVGRA